MFCSVRKITKSYRYTYLRQLLWFYRNFRASVIKQTCCCLTQWGYRTSLDTNKSNLKTGSDKMSSSSSFTGSAIDSMAKSFEPDLGKKLSQSPLSVCHNLEDGDDVFIEPGSYSSDVRRFWLVRYKSKYHSAIFVNYQIYFVIYLYGRNSCHAL